MWRRPWSWQRHRSSGGDIRIYATHYKGEQHNNGGFVQAIAQACINNAFTGVGTQASFGVHVTVTLSQPLLEHHPAADLRHNAVRVCLQEQPCMSQNQQQL